MRYVRSHRLAFGLNRADLRTFHLQDYVDIAGTHHVSWTQRAGASPCSERPQGQRHGRRSPINVTGPPVHALRVTSTLRVTATGALGAAAARRSASRLQKGGQLGGDFHACNAVALTASYSFANTVGGICVRDVKTGALLWRANLTHADAVGTGQAVGMYPGGDVPNGGGDLQPVTFPVFDGTALSGNNAHVFADVNDDDVAAPKDEVPALTGTDWSGYLPQFDTTDASQNRSTHFTAHGTRPSRMTGTEPQLVRRPALFLPQHVPLSPPGGAYRSTEAHNFQATNTSGLGLGDAVQGHFLDGANTANGFDGGHINNANFTTPTTASPA